MRSQNNATENIFTRLIDNPVAHKLCRRMCFLKKSVLHSLENFLFDPRVSAPEKNPMNFSFYSPHPPGLFFFLFRGRKKLAPKITTYSTPIITFRAFFCERQRAKAIAFPPRRGSVRHFYPRAFWFFKSIRVVIMGLWRASELGREGKKKRKKSKKTFLPN